MKEQNIDTQIGSEIHVTVFFDYMPEQKETAFDEQMDASVTINKVLVNGNKEFDIVECLSDGCLLNLKDECFNYIKIYYGDCLGN